MKLYEFITQSLLDIRNGIRSVNAKIDGSTLGVDQAAHFQMGPYNDEWIYNYSELNTAIISLKTKLAKYYENIIQPKPFEYELLK